MSETPQVYLRLELSRGQFRLALTFLALAVAATELASENVTLTTFYPAPSGVYAKMITTGDTTLARDGGNVGIGTAAPSVKLEVVGQFKLKDGSQAAGKVLTSDDQGLATWTVIGGLKNCVWITGPTKGKPNWSVATCPGVQTVRGWDCLWSNNEKQQPQIKMMPTDFSCRYVGDGGNARAKAYCCDP